MVERYEDYMNEDAPVEEEIVIPEVVESDDGLFFKALDGDCTSFGETKIGDTDSGLRCMENCYDRGSFAASWQNNGGRCYCEDNPLGERCW